MELTKEQAFQNITAVVKQFRGLTIDEAEAIKQSLMVLDKIVNQKKEEIPNG
jgi:hypothetical protein